MNVQFYNVDFLDEHGNLDHNATVRMNELPALAQGRKMQIRWQVETEDALNMTREERGVPA